VALKPKSSFGAPALIRFPVAPVAFSPPPATWDVESALGAMAEVQRALDGDGEVNEFPPELCDFAKQVCEAFQRQDADDVKKFCGYLLNHLVVPF
jgi:hypothetical protein